MDMLSAMRIFVRVVDRGSMSVAARDLNTSQSTVSARIDSLERHLNIRLLQRTSRVMSCTAEGAEFYRRCEAIVASADEAFAALAQMNSSISGNIRIACPQCFGSVVLPRVISQISKRYPELGVEIILNDSIVNPATEGVDLSFRLGARLEETMIATRLGYIRRTLVASPQYLAENAPISSPHDLASHPFIHEKGSISGGKLTLIDGDGQSDDYPITSRVITNQWHPVYEMLASGAGIGVLQAPACWPALRDGLLVPLLPNFNVPGLELNVLLPAGRPIPSRTRETIHLTKACLPEVWGFSPEP